MSAVGQRSLTTKRRAIRWRGREDHAPKPTATALALLPKKEAASDAQHTAKHVSYAAPRSGVALEDLLTLKRHRLELS